MYIYSFFFFINFIKCLSILPYTIYEPHSVADKKKQNINIK